MSTPAQEQPGEGAPAEPPQAEEPAEVLELGRISDTEGGFIGAKYDTAVGWQYY